MRPSRRASASTSSPPSSNTRWSFVKRGGHAWSGRFRLDLSLTRGPPGAVWKPPVMPKWRQGQGRRSSSNQRCLPWRRTARTRRPTRALRKRAGATPSKTMGSSAQRASTMRRPWATFMAMRRPHWTSGSSGIAPSIPQGAQVYSASVDQATHGPREGIVPPAMFLDVRWRSWLLQRPARGRRARTKEAVSMPSRPIPPRPSLEFDRKQARALLEAVRRGDADAEERFRSHHPRFRDGAIVRPALYDAQLVVAREYGVASWPRWKQLVETRQLEARERAALLVRAACEGDMRQASTLLAADPALERFDLYTACVAGADGEVARRLDRDSALARGRGGPLAREPILYACFSRFLRSDAKRAAGIVRVVRLLLDRGADVHVHFLHRDGNETWVQTSLYG